MFQNYIPRPQIFSIFPSDKVVILLEDATNLRRPKIRIAMVPTAKGAGEFTEFYIDLAVTRVIFGDLALLGCLQDDCLTKEIKGKQDTFKVFDLFAKIGENGHRSLTISNMTDGIFIKNIKKNGSTETQSASLNSFQARTMGQAVTAYLAQINLLDLATAAPVTVDIDTNSDDDHPEGDFPG